MNRQHQSNDKRIRLEYYHVRIRQHEEYVLFIYYGVRSVKSLKNYHNLAHWSIALNMNVHIHLLNVPYKRAIIIMVMVLMVLIHYGDV
ncbi:hypothetical protein BLA29_015205 [Euroglyphus maynei]|uniref:Uncharacterized protein n=1 Tax=Euroglyphus maynei TaxID=6958 RepID=A0A1Y3AU47_EURMA|nr:hypothetical protein BLA29_015205 [Euroglyphus maynei]